MRPAGGPVGSRHRQQLNGEFIAALLRDFRQGGPKAIERVRRTQPAAYLKILALLVPREHKVEHRNPVKDMTDEELEAAIEFIQKMLATQAEKAKVIDGTTEATALQSRHSRAATRVGHIRSVGRESAKQLGIKVSYFDWTGPDVIGTAMDQAKQVATEHGLCTTTSATRTFSTRLHRNGG